MKTLLTLLFGLMVGTAFAAPQVQELNRIVAVVNEDVVTAQELEARTETIVRQLEESGTRLPPPDVLQKQVLDRLVMERLQLERAEQMGVQVDDEAVNEVVADIAAENSLPLDRFRRVLEEDGYDFAEFRDNIRRELTLSQLHRRVVQDRVKVTEQEVRNHLEQTGAEESVDREYRLAHILVAVPQTPGPEQVQAAKQKAERLLQELREGADFGQSAVANSDGQQALNGGDLGWRKRGQLPTLFAELVVDMKPGDISDLIRSPSGFHILKLVEERGGEQHVVRQTRARHILIRTNEMTTDEQAQSRLEDLRKRIANGADFAELARAHSEDPGSAARGGDLGWSGPGQMVPEFEEKMNETPMGQVSEPFRSPFGWHIVQPLERRDHDSTDEYRLAQAREQLQRRKADQELEQWLRQLHDEAYVEYRLEP